MALKTSPIEELPSLNLTSMIDVVFLLLIFFMVATKFSESQQQVGVKLSGSAGMQSMLPAPDKMEVGVARDGSLTLDSKPISQQELVSRIKEKRSHYPALVVGVNGDPDASNLSVVTTIQAVRSVGIADIRIGVRDVRR